MYGFTRLMIINVVFIYNNEKTEKNPHNMQLRGGKLRKSPNPTDTYIPLSLSLSSALNEAGAQLTERFYLFPFPFTISSLGLIQ